MGTVLTSKSLKHKHLLFTHQLMIYWFPGNNFISVSKKENRCFFKSNANENEAPQGADAGWSQSLVKKSFFSVSLSPSAAGCLQAVL